MQEKSAPYDYVTLTPSFGFDTELQRDERARIVAYELRRYSDRAKQILIRNNELFHELVEMLIEKKTLTYKDLNELTKQYKLSE